MADYYTRTVITEPMLLTDLLRDVLTERGACCEPTGKSENVLDGIVNERPPLAEFYITFDEGWEHVPDDVDEYLVDYRGWDDEDCENASPEFRELVVGEEHEILREILKVNPEKQEIDQQSGWGCNKMRLDGFGGSGLIVNRKGFLYITTSNFEVESDGTIKLGSTFTTWEEYDQAAAEHDEDAACGSPG